MRDLALRILPVYQESDQDRFLANLSALQLVAQDYPSAAATRQNLRARRNSDAGRGLSRTVVYDIYARARLSKTVSACRLRRPSRRPIARSCRDSTTGRVFHDAVVRRPLSTMQDALQRAFDQRRVEGQHSSRRRIDLVWAYLHVRRVSAVSCRWCRSWSAGGSAALRHGRERADQDAGRRDALRRRSCARRLRSHCRRCSSSSLRSLSTMLARARHAAMWASWRTRAVCTAARTSPCCSRMTARTREPSSTGSRSSPGATVASECMAAATAASLRGPRPRRCRLR